MHIVIVKNKDISEITFVVLESLVVIEKEGEKTLVERS